MKAAEDRRRVGVRVEGTVQGVGFRPFVYRLAHEEALAGHVLNDEQGVLIELEGPGDAVDRLLARLRAEAPPLATIDRIASSTLPPTGAGGFEIRASNRGATPDALISPDTATCDDCLRELFDAADRRHRYPFLNCTNCGPRLTIVRGVPYDRALTTMAGFGMCSACLREYCDPRDRRFHAQPNACPACGPQVSLVDAAGRPVTVPGARDPVDGAARGIAAGLIVAIKGLGGYHLACNGADDAAVRALRTRKRREDRPFALMVADVGDAARIIVVGAEEAALLSAPGRPIVLAPRRAGSAIAAAVAPRSPDLGVMLAYTPLHHLLLTDAAAALGGPATLVMTSGNISDEPIAYGDDDALRRLGGIADIFLLGDRAIETRVDDSVARVVSTGHHGQRRAQVLRRSRGYVPSPLVLPQGGRRPLLACGADLKSTFCLARGPRAWLSHHLGDLEHYPAYASFEAGVAHFEGLFQIRPEVVAHDLHPDYRSTAYALEREGVELVGVQHHHAHLAACLAEHSDEPAARAVGAIYDGTGYGTDGTIWGGEILVGGLGDFDRVATLRPIRMPGGAAAIREPWRMACAWLTELLGEAPPIPPGLAGHVDPAAWRTVSRLSRQTALAPVTTSMGRLFDAVAALCGFVPVVTYEGQAAIEFAACARRDVSTAYELAVRDDVPGPARWTLDAGTLVAAVLEDLRIGTDVATVSARFHAAVAAATVQALALAADAAGLDTVVLSGGVFQNQRLLEDVSSRARRRGLRVLTPERVPCNDGGISFGQAAIAAVLDAA